MKKTEKKTKKRTNQSDKNKDGLTPQQERFCLEYLKDLNASQAALRADYSENSPNVQGSRLLANDNIQQKIIELNEQRKKEIQIDTNFVLSELHKIASIDIGGAFNDDGSVKVLSEMESAVRKAISSLEIVEYYEGYGEDRKQVGWIKKIKFWSKDKALENLGRHLKLFVDRIEREDKVTLEGLITGTGISDD